MTGILLTQDSGLILGPIAKLLGIIMNAIFNLLSNIGIENIAICIIIFTLLVNILMLPLTLKQQKFSKLSAKMNPEIQAINKKYKGKNDQASMLKMQEETQAVYDKYGTSPTGSCLQLLITMPILFGLYRVIYRIPAYVDSVKEVLLPLTDKIMQVPNYESVVSNFVESAKITRVGLDFSSATSASNSIVDVLYKCTTDGWNLLKDTFTSLGDTIVSVEQNMESMNNFLGLNIANSPITIIKNSFSSGEYLVLIIAILIPVIAALVTLLNTKLMPQQISDDGNPMASSMKTMNLMMPILQAFLCLTLQTGVGIYIITGALIRCVIQVIANKQMDNLDLDAIIEKNKEKAEKKREKRGIKNQEILNNARINTKKIQDVKNTDNLDSFYNTDAKPGSMREKANLVKDFNERNSK